MFAVYNKGSVQFRSTSDNLYTLEKVDKAAASRHKPDDELYYSFDDFLKKKNSQRSLDKGIETYKKISSMDTSERVYYVKEIMSTELICVDTQSTLLDAYNTLKENHISQLPIVTYGNHITSMISKKTILNFLLESNEPKEKIMGKKLQDLSFNELITSDPNSDIKKVAKVMLNYQIDAMPIVDKNGVVIGILSKTDLIKAISHISDIQFWA